MKKGALLVALALGGCATPVVEPPAKVTTADTTAGSTQVDPPTEEPAQPPAKEPEVKPQPTHSLGMHEPAALLGGDTLEVDGVVIESIEASPQDPESYPGGSGIDVTVVMKRGKLELRAYLSLLSEGYQSRPVGWLDDYRVTLLEVSDPYGDVKVALVVEKVGAPLPGAPMLTQQRVDKGGELKIEEYTRLRFLGHGHKSVMKGSSSPLIVSVEWLVPGSEDERHSHNLGPDDGDMSWRWRDLWLSVDDYQYDQWMTLSVRRLGLERV